MLAQNKLKPFEGSTKKRKRVGRGNSAGGGTTCGRGTKGQRSRTGKKLKAWFEGGQTPLIQKMPKLKGFKNSRKLDYFPVNLDRISDSYKDGETVEYETLLSKKIISKNDKYQISGRGLF